MSYLQLGELGVDRWKWKNGKAGDFDAAGHSYGSAKTADPAPAATAVVATPAAVVAAPVEVAPAVVPLFPTTMVASPAVSPQYFDYGAPTGAPASEFNYDDPTGAPTSPVDPAAVDPAAADPAAVAAGFSGLQIALAVAAAAAAAWYFSKGKR